MKQSCRGVKTTGMMLAVLFILRMASGLPATYAAFERLANNPCRELGTVIRADIFRRAMLDKELCETTQDIIRL